MRVILYVTILIIEDCVGGVSLKNTLYFRLDTLLQDVHISVH